MSATPALSVQNVSVSYGAKRVVAGLSLDIPKGSTFGLIGLNGAGKTTLIKAILGLRRIDEGQILIEGMNAAKAESRQSFAFLPERFDPPFFLTGFEFLRFAAQFYSTSFNEQAAMAAAETLALKNTVLKDRIQTYSKGMRQKLGILSVMLTECPLLILDEPMSGLDPMARALVKEALLQIQAQGRTVFLSSHILADMNEICGGVAVLHNGRIVFEGPPAGLLKTAGADTMDRAFLTLISQDKAA